MRILRDRLGFAALQMFPEDKQDEISSSVLGVGTRGELTEMYTQGPPATLIRKAFCLGVPQGLYLIATGQGQQAGRAGLPTPVVSPASFIPRHLKRFYFKNNFLS